MHASQLTDDLIRRATTIAYSHTKQRPLVFGDAELIFVEPAKLEMSPGISRGIPVEIEIESWEQLYQVRERIVEVRGDDEIVGRDERRYRLESLDQPAREHIYRQRFNILADRVVGRLPPGWIDVVLNAEYGQFEKASR